MELWLELVINVVVLPVTLVDASKSLRDLLERVGGSLSHRAENCDAPERPP